MQVAASKQTDPVLQKEPQGSQKMQPLSVEAGQQKKSSPELDGLVPEHPLIWESDWTYNPNDFSILSNWQGKS